MSELSNPHDRFFKKTFERPEIAADFLANYLPAEALSVLEVSRAEPVKGSFVDARLQELFSDLLYRVGLRRGGEAFIYVLIEHKSAPDHWVALQLLRYMINIWEQAAREKPGKLPPILPLVLYHGERTWTAPRNFRDLIDWEGAEELREYAPGFEYLLCDLSAFEEEEIRGEAELRMVLLALKYVSAADLGAWIVAVMRVFKASPHTIELLRLVFTYWSAARGLQWEEVTRAFVEVFPGQEDNAMLGFVEEAEQKGRQEGLREGLREGRREAAIAMTLRQLRRKVGAVDAPLEDQVRSLPLEQLEDLGEALLGFATRADLEAWLSARAGA